MYERINICKTSFLFVRFAFTIAVNRSYSSLVIFVDTVTCRPFCAVHNLAHVGRLLPLLLIVPYIYIMPPSSHRNPCVSRPLA